jgi:hypothetical protein
MTGEVAYGEVAYGRPPHGRREDPVEFIETFVRNYSSATIRRVSGSSASGNG